MRILLAGCGDLGGELGLRLCAAGAEVHGLRRRPGRVPPPISPIGADLASGSGLKAVPRDVDAVLYVTTPDRIDDDAYERAYVRGLRNLLGVLPDGGRSLQRLLFVSSTSVYGIDDGSRVDESTATAATRFAGQRLLEGEALLRPVPGAVTIRFGGIYGPGRERLLDRVRRGEPVIAEPPRWTNRIHREDCIGVLQHLLHLPDPQPLYLAVDSAPSPLHVVTDWLAEHLGVPTPPHRRQDTSSSAASGKRCSNNRLLESGYRLRYPDFRTGYASMINPAG